jgi:hypothetical protein
MEQIKLTILFLISFSFSVFSQNDTIKIDSTKYFSNDQIVFDFNYDYWLNIANDIKISPYTLSSNVHIMFPIAGQHSNVSLAAGIGLGTYNIKSNAQLLDTNDITFYSIIPDTIEYQKNKLALSYVDIPFELRFRTNPREKGRSFKIYLGFKAGILLSSHTKYKGQDFSDNEKEIKIKSFTVKNLTPFRYGITAKIGYGKFMINAFYSLSGLLDKDSGPEITPISIGITINPF